MFKSLTRRRPRLVIAAVVGVLVLLGLFPASAASGPQVFNVGTAPFFGDLRNVTLSSPIVDLSVTPSGNGYWQVAANGGMFTFGDAPFYGSTGSFQLNSPIVAMAGFDGGYYLLSRDGGVFTFGPSAPFRGSGGGTGKQFSDIVLMPGGGGYWLLATDGSVLAFGATGVGSQPPAAGLPAGVTAVALASTPAGDGLWTSFSNGRVDPAGAAADLGDAPTGVSPIDATASPDGSGLWLVTATGRVEGLGTATRSDDVTADKPVVAIAAQSSDGYWVATEGNGPGSISGRVLDDLGRPAASACLFLNDAPSPQAQTASDGTFRISPVGPGTVRLKIGSCAGDDRWAFEYYKDARFSFEATPISVTAGQDTALGDIVIDRAAAITGVVRGRDGDPLAGACVQTSFGQARTSVTGYYRLGGLPSGSYIVNFNDCGRGDHLAEYYDDAPTADRATPVPVAVAETRSGIDAQLSKAGAISGVVSTSDGGALGPPACVAAVDHSGAVRQAAISVTGFYRLPGLRNGTYKLHFNDCPQNFVSTRNDYVDEWWNDQATEDAATPITVVASAPDVTGINPVLVRGGKISGVVTRADGGAPAAGQCVDALQGTTSVRTNTTVTGYYELKGLRPGAYRVRFGGCFVGVGSLAAEWWSDAPSASTSTPVTVGSGETRPGIDAALDAAGFLEGRVTDEQGNGVLACVDVFDDGMQLSFGNRANIGGITGNYRIGGLNSASYSLRFRDCRSGNPSAFANQWFRDAATKGGGTPVAAVRGQTLPVPTAVMGQESGISGVVTSDDGLPVRGVCVRAYLPDGSEVLQNQMSVTTTVTGFYRVPRLPASTYKVRFDGSCNSDGYASEWWQDAPTMAAATSVSTTIGQTTPNVDAVLSIPGRPVAPTGVSATAGRRSATVSWTGVSDGRGAITGYRITATPGGAVVVAAAGDRSAVVDGLEPNQRYTFTVAASNAFGTGPGTTSNEVRVIGGPTKPKLR
jgi:hypothetical protein